MFLCLILLKFAYVLCMLCQIQLVLNVFIVRRIKQNTDNLKIQAQLHCINIVVNMNASVNLDLKLNHMLHGIKPVLCNICSSVIVKE